MENLIGIYTICFSDLFNTIKLENLGTINGDDIKSITDQQMDTFEISKNVHGFIYKCNMTHHFLMSTKKLPVAYINVCYTKYPLKVVLLYRIFLYFKIDNVDHIKKIQDLVEKDFSGNFIIEASIGDQVLEIENIEKGKNNNGELNKIMVELTKSNDMMVLIGELIDDIEKAMSIQYKDDDMWKMPDMAIKKQNQNQNHLSDK